MNNGRISTAGRPQVGSIKPPLCFYIVNETCYPGTSLAAKSKRGSLEYVWRIVTSNLAVQELGIVYCKF
jgi:hypothetical protein